MKALVKLVDASKSYGHHAVFEDLSLSIKPGTVTAIVSPVAGGKTTLLRCLAGVEPLTSGEVIHRAPVVGLVSTIPEPGDPPSFVFHADLSSPCVIVADEPTYVMAPVPDADACRNDPSLAYSADVTFGIMAMFDTMTDAGHAVVFTTHDPRAINAADVVVDL